MVLPLLIAADIVLFVGMQRAAFKLLAWKRRLPDVGTMQGPSGTIRANVETINDFVVIIKDHVWITKDHVGNIVEQSENMREP